MRGVTCTQDEMLETFAAAGLTVLNPDDYKHARTRMAFRCPVGHFGEIHLIGIKRGHGCRTCAYASRHLSSEEVIATFELAGIQPLDITEYHHCNSKMHFICKAGHEGQMAFRHIRSGHGCGICNHAKAIKRLRFTIDEISSFARIVNLTLAPGQQYTNCNQKLHFFCDQGHECITSAAILRMGCGCQQCGYVRRDQKLRHTWSEVQAEFAARGFILTDDTYINTGTLLTTKCSKGHTFQISLDNVRNGTGCRYCYYLKRFGIEEHPNRTDFEKKASKTCRAMLRRVLLATEQNTSLARVKYANNILGYDGPLLIQHILNHSNWNTTVNGPWCMPSQYGWHIDHVFPVVAFLNYGIYDPAIINALDNLQPLSAKTNISKCDHYDPAIFETYLSKKGVPFTPPNHTKR